MVARAHERYPGERGRRFRVITLPPRSRFDGAWLAFSRDGRDLPMTFAMPLRASATGGESMTNVSLETDPTAIDTLAERVPDLPPDELYARYRGTYPDTMLGYFAARHELGRFKHGFQDPAARQFCRSLPTAGRDFPKPLA